MPASVHLPLPLPVAATQPGNLALAAQAAPPPPLARLAPYCDLVAAAAGATELPFWLLAAIVEQESRFEPRARSTAGAIGLMQILPATARDWGQDPARLWDPGANVEWGARIFADGCRVFQQEAPNQRLQFALAAYKGGIGTVLATQDLAAERHLDPHLWISLSHVLPEVRLPGGRHPDYRRIQHYVRAIWRRFQAWSLLAPPCDLRAGADSRRFPH